MKFCYLDESASSDESLIVMAGIVVDSHRMHKTKESWEEFLGYLSKVCQASINEFHAKDFIAGAGVWKSMDGARRAEVTLAILKWIKRRAHRVTFSAVLKSAFSDMPSGRGLPKVWHAAALHCVLTIQKWSQQQKNNKGHTVFVFDRGRDEAGLTELCYEPPEWTDQYYGRDIKSVQLDQLVDVPLFADSRMALLIQVADLVSYVLRRYWEVASGHSPARYSDEAARIEAWIRALDEVMIERRFRYPARGRNDAEDVYWQLCPDVLRR